MSGKLPASELSKEATIKTPLEIKSIREACRITALAVDKALKSAKPGVSTGELDLILRDFIVKSGAKPAFLGLYGFPSTACISLNHEIVHGLPDDTLLCDGDLLSIDCGSIVDGMYSDMARTKIVGDKNLGDKVAQDLLQCTRTALELGISEACSGKRVGDIGHAVESYALRNGFQVVREYVGHGVGRELHEPPQVPNFGEPHTGAMLTIGMVLAIEPMLTAGDWRTKTAKDGWTIETLDGKLAAHFEDTVVITENGPEVLTKI